MTLRSAPLACVLVLLAASGCYTFRAALPGTLRQPAAAEDIVIVGHFDHKETTTYLLFGILGQSPPDLFARAIREEVARHGGDGLVNIIVDTQYETGDVVVSTLTLSLVTPRTYRMRADIVKLSTAPLAGRSLLSAREHRAPSAPEYQP